MRTSIPPLDSGQFASGLRARTDIRKLDSQRLMKQRRYSAASASGHERSMPVKENVKVCVV